MKLEVLKMQAIEGFYGSATELAQKHSLDPSALCRVRRKEYTNHKGWRVLL